MDDINLMSSSVSGSSLLLWRRSENEVSPRLELVVPVTTKRELSANKYSARKKNAVKPRID